MCLKCEDATSVGACNDNSAASQQLCEGNEDTCWFRITYEKDGTEKTVNAGCKACKDAQGQKRDVQNAQSNNCRGDSVAAWGNKRIIGPEAVCNYCVKRDADVNVVVGYLTTAVTGTNDAASGLNVHNNQPGQGGAFSP